MFAYLKRLWHSKVQINIHIVYPVAGVTRITSPTVIEKSPLKITRHRQSDYRFVSVEKVELDGTKRQYWNTERKEGKQWVYCGDTLSHDRDEAMELHKLIILNGTVSPVTTKTVEWEGLSVEETLTWVGMSKNA